jgi:predicted enzyme related to lactoylglutathione lyase
MARLLVNIDVPDLDAATEFYASVFDLRVGRRFGDGGVELLGAEAPLYLLAKAPDSAPFAGAPQPRDFARHWTPVHLDFAVDDIDAALRRAEAAGATRESEIIERRWGRMALLADPFGHGICLLQFAGRGYDEIATG